MLANYAALPVAFEPNQGQAASDVQYVGRGKGYRLYLTSTGATMEVHRGNLDSEVLRMMRDRRLGPAKTMRMLEERRRNATANESFSAAVRMQMVNANPKAQLVASERESGKVNYLVGKDRTKWHSNIPQYGRVEYKEVYNGVDVAFHGAGSQVEFDYLVNPNADPSQIALKFDGAEMVRKADNGNLVLSTPAGDVQLLKPVAYQGSDASRQLVDVGFAISGNRVSFRLGKYDRSRQLVIDPTMTYSTYFGGSLVDYGIGIAVDSSGNEYVAGTTDSTTLPLGTNGTTGGFDVFVIKISSSGQLNFTTIFGGASGDDSPGGIAVDSQAIYVGGTTSSQDFPVSQGAAQTKFMGGTANGNNDAFAVSMSLDGTMINWATYVGGNDSDSGLGVAVDSSHNVYVVGETFSTNLPVKNPLASGSAVNLGQNSGKNDDGYIAVVNSTGAAFNMVSYIGGSQADVATGIALDGSGNAYICGETTSSDFPVTSGVAQSSIASAGNDDAFVVAIKASSFAAPKTQSGSRARSNKVTPRHHTLSGLWLAFPGLAVVSICISCRSSSQRRVFGLLLLIGLLGVFLSMPACGGSSSSGGGGGGGGSDPTLIYSTYYGGSSGDDALAIAADSAGNVFVVGETQSPDFPVTSLTLQGKFGGTQNAFLVGLNSSGTKATYSTYLGGTGVDTGLGVAVDGNDIVYITGQTSSSDFPTANPIQGTFGGSTDAFVTVVDPATNALVFSDYLGGSGDEDQFFASIAFDSLKNIYVTGDTDSGNGTTTPFPTSFFPIQATWASGGTCQNTEGATVPCPDAFVTAYTTP